MISERWERLNEVFHAAVALRPEERVAFLANDPSPDVQVQVAIASRKIVGLDPLPVLARLLARCGFAYSHNSNLARVKIR